jgi:hypothetical protein
VSASSVACVLFFVFGAWRCQGLPLFLFVDFVLFSLLTTSNAIVDRFIIETNNNCMNRYMLEQADQTYARIEQLVKSLDLKLDEEKAKPPRPTHTKSGQLVLFQAEVLYCQ